MGAMMRSYFLRASLALAVLVLPAFSGAATGPFTWKLERYPSLDGAGTTVKEADFNNVIPLGFDFQFYGQTFNEVKVGNKGYLSLGYNDTKGTDHIPAADSTLPASGSPPAMNSSSAPGNIVAVWWGTHHCDPNNGVKYHFIGTAPDRTFIAEWNCAADSNNPPDTRFRAQIRLHENSSVLQLIYDKLTLANGSSADWTTVRAGIKNHDGSQSHNLISSCPSGACKRADFPENTVFQFGVWLDNPTWPNNAADLMVEIDTASIDSGIEHVDLGDGNGAQDYAFVEFEGLLRNLSEKAAVLPVTYEVYLSTRQGSVTAGNPIMLRLRDPSGQGEPIAGYPDPASEIPITPPGGRFYTPVQPGKYFLCINAVSWANEQPGAANGTANNWSCSPEPLLFGPDLTGSVSGLPSQINVLEPFTVNVTIRNDGNQTAVVTDNPITFTIDLIDEQLRDWVELVTPGALRVVKTNRPWEDSYDQFVGEIWDSLAPGAEVSMQVTVMYPFVTNNDHTTFFVRVNVDQFWVSGEDESRDADSDSNAFLSSQSLKLLVPNYVVETGPGMFDFEMPMGCVLGEAVRGEVEICNQGNADGFGFRPEIWLRVGEFSGDLADENGIMATVLPYCLGIREPALAEDGVTPIPGRREQIDDQSMCDPGTICSLGACWTPCDPEDSQVNNGCAPGFKCMWNPMVTIRHPEVINTCVPYIEKGECSVYEYEGVFPQHEFGFNDNIADPPHFPIPDMSEVMPYHMANRHQAPSENSASIVNWDEEMNMLLCQYPRADIEAVSMPTLILDVVAGNPFNVERRFRNLGTFATDFEYGYYMSIVPELSAKQWPVPVLGSPDELGRSWIDRKVLKTPEWTTSDGIDQRFDTVVIPADVEPGEYWFGMVVDPNGKLDELSKANNTFIYPFKLRVHEPNIRIETLSLPLGTVGVRYNLTLWASGGIGGFRWEKGEGFPSWLDLDPLTGHLSGIPPEPRDYVFTVRVRSGAVEARKTYALRILETQGRLSIPKHVLPVAVTNQTYGPVELKANGGLPPYKWTTTALDGTGTGMPPGFCSQDGVIRSGRCDQTDLGDVPNIDPGAYRFLAIVEDARGAVDVEELTLYVAGFSALRITTETLAPLTVGESMHNCISADGGNPDNYEWTVTGLPRGMVATPELRQVCIQGAPLEFGAFMVNVTVSDQGMQASRMFSLEVTNRDIQLARSHLGEFSQGASVDELLETSFDAQIRIVQGRLPSGLELTPDNRIQGTISPNAEVGNYSVLLELRTADGQISLAGLGISVTKAEKEEEKKGDTGGCGSSATNSSTGTGFGIAAVMLGLLGSLRSRRRAEESN